MSTPFGASLRPVFHSALALCALAFFVLAAPLHAATTYYVSPSGNDNNAGTQAAPYKTIFQGINNAATGDTVTLMDGTYTGTGNVDLDAQGKSITVNSVNGATATIIDCGGTSSANHRAFYLHTKEAGVSITGLTLQNGYADGAVYVGSGCTATLTNCILTTNYGSDGPVYNLGTVTLIGCAFTKNNAGNYGGGGLYNTGTATLTNCTFTGNMVSYSGSGGVTNTGTTMLTNCTLSSNSGSGVTTSGTATLMGCIINSNNNGGVSNGGKATLTNCTLSANTAPSGSGGGFYNTSTATLTNCAITGNTIASGKGGGLFNNGTATLTGCTIKNNSASTGGGVEDDSYGVLVLMGCNVSNNTASNGNGGGIGSNYGGVQLTLTNCILSGNTAISGNGGGVYNLGTTTLRFCSFSNDSTQTAGTQGGALENDGTATLTNDILWGNTAPSFPEIGISPTGNPVTTVTYCDIQGGYSGNLKADPLFVIAASDFHLKVGSPCIGAGTAITGPSGVPTDFDGKTRANPPTIGAYEGGVAVGGHSHLLWNNSDGRVMLWSIAQDGSFTLNGFGPYTDGAPGNVWSATAVATGADGKSHLLWNNTDGRVMLWTVDDAGNFTLAGYGPYTDNAPNNKWSATAVSVGPDGTVHLLWNNTDHRVMLWNVAPDFSFSLAGYGPYTDNAPGNLWSATALATGPDGVSHILWNNTDNRVMLWNVAPSFSFTLAGYGPYTDGAPQNQWSAAGLSVGPDNVQHILWTNTDRRAMFWNVDVSFNFTLAGFGPYTDNAPGNLWSAAAVATGPDGLSHLLWDNTDNRAMLWGVDSAFNFTVAGYGPYTDNAPGNLWSATAVSAGP